ncbi:MAG: cytochrome c biogenesis protein ResB [Solobacterium sp.]|nr:cytochrome c biogenesis protein ResB [Solobacterium sp.]
MGKKLWSFVTSMKFGLILLGLIIVISLAGSLIPQNNEVMYYVREFPQAYKAILFLHLNNVFKSWYFLLLVFLLCLNLLFCTMRQAKAAGTPDTLPEQFTPAVPVTENEAEAVHEVLKKMGCAADTNGTVTRYTKQGIGMYGSFLLHTGILLTMVFWALGSVVPKIIDETCMPKESILLEDGTEIKVNDFAIEDETGRLDYASNIEIILADGRSSGEQRVSVNHPVSMGDYKVYQQTYGTKGKVTVTDKEGHADSFYLTSQDFLSADGMNGIWFDDLYPGFEQKENGALTLITNTTGSYENPVYVFVLADHDKNEQMLAFPGDSVTIDDLTFTFNDPVEYPGLRIKKSPAIINLFLLISVILLTLGLYLIFFRRPINVLVSKDGYTVIGRNEALSLDLKHACAKEHSETV